MSDEKPNPAAERIERVRRLLLSQERSLLPPIKNLRPVEEEPEEGLFEERLLQPWERIINEQE